jgi:hypothetical protein
MKQCVEVNEAFLLARSIPEPNTGCWLWLGWLDADGYGGVKYGGRSRRATHVALEIVDRPLASGQVAMHRCDNPPCVNPAHLVGGSKLENARDCVSKGRKRKGANHPRRMQPELWVDGQPRGDSHGRRKLCEREVLEIIARHAKGDGSHTSLAREYGVSRPAISLLLEGKTWAHVPRPHTATAPSAFRASP